MYLQTGCVKGVMEGWMDCWMEGGRRGRLGQRLRGIKTPEHSWDPNYQRDGNDRLLALEKPG